MPLSLCAVRTVVTAGLALALCGCQASGPEDRLVIDKPGLKARYSRETGKLQRLEVDTNHNGRIDMFSSMDGTAIVLIEIDRDEDGTIDRWEHYDHDNTKVVSVGTSSRGDGVEDTITWPPDAHGDVRVEIDADRNGQVDRREILRTDTQGRSYLAVVETEFDATGAPGFRMSYGPGGVFLKSERLR